MTDPITPDRMADLLGPGWTLEGSRGKWHRFRYELRDWTTDHVYVEARLNPKTATVSYGVEHDPELTYRTSRILGESREAWQAELTRRHREHWGNRTYAAHGPIYATWGHCPPELVELVVLPIIGMLTVAARAAVREIEINREAGAF